ncbi:MAG: PEGA domain-containing protein, partial [Candidatus Hydrogenedentes bacterium]|nr:PEGA domain-containing protein [Candidatus Hydrogenedentota bacterium]
LKALLIACSLLLLAAGGCQTVTMHARITSEPSDAEIVEAPDPSGQWVDYGKTRPRIDGQRYTPSQFEWKMKPGETIWVKVRKKDYKDSQEARITAERYGPKHQYADVHFDLATDGQVRIITSPEEPDWVRPNKPDAGPSVRGTVVWIESNPPGATVLVAESMDGTYHPWRNAIGEPITPVKGKVPVGDTFWVKVKKGNRESDPEYVHIESTLDRTISFDLERGSAGAMKEKIIIRSNPPGATVLVSDKEFGTYHPWPPGARSQQTPMEVEVDVGSSFWIKLRKDKYQTTEPQFIQIERGKTLTVDATLSRFLSSAPPAQAIELPQPQLLAAPAAPDGVEVSGYAPIADDVAAARKAAIMDALGSAIEQRFGGEIASHGVANNYLMMQNRIEASAEGRYASYDIVEQTEERGLCRVVLRVRFKEDAIRALQSENVTFLLGGVESIDSDLGAISTSARHAVADALRAGSLAVTVKEDPIPSPGDLARLAGDSKTIKYQSDFVLHIKADTELYDKYGEFYTCMTTLDYQLLQPVSPSPFIPADFAHIVATGSIEQRNRKPQLKADRAGKHAIEDAADALAAEVLERLTQLYDGASTHEVYVVGFLDQRERQTLKTELERLPGVRQVRYLPFSRADAPEGDPNRDMHQFLIYLTPSARVEVPNAIQRLTNVDLEVVETDLYNTVAYVRKPPVEQ